MELGSVSFDSDERARGVTETQLSILVSMESAKRLSLEPELADKLATSVRSHCAHAWDLAQNAEELRRRLSGSARWVQSFALPNLTEELESTARPSAPQMPQLCRLGVDIEAE